MILKLVRLSELNRATLGVLLFDNFPLMFTLEDAWRDNERGISCIPEKNYKIKRVSSQKFGNTFEVQNVEARSHILFHAGNVADDTSGCILLGTKTQIVNNEPMLLNSRKAFLQFLNYLNGINEADLMIVAAYGGGRSH